MKRLIQRPRSTYVRLPWPSLSRGGGRWSGGRSVLRLLVGWFVAGCSSTLDPASGDPRRDLQHADPRVRIDATEQVVRESRMDLCGLLVKNLDDPDGAVRLFSSVALRKLTGEDFGYKAHGTLVERREAVERWKRWLESEGLLAREVGPTGEPSDIEASTAPAPSSPASSSPASTQSGASAPDSDDDGNRGADGALPPLPSPPLDSASDKPTGNVSPREKKSDQKADDRWVGTSSNAARS